MRLLPATRPREPAGERAPKARVVLIEPDPYLAYLIRLHVPDAEVVETGVGVTVADLRAMGPDLVVMGLDHTSLPIADLLAGEDPPKVLAIVEAARAARTAVPTAVEGVLARPFVPAELERAIATALGRPLPGGGMGIGRALARARSWLGPVRVGAVAIAAVLEVAGTTVSQARAMILAIAFVYATIRWVLARPSVVADGADVAMALAVIAATGGVQSHYVPFGLVVAAGIGVLHGPRWGGLGGLVIVTGSTVGAVRDIARDLLGVQELAALVVLFALMGVSGGFAGHVWGGPQPTEGLAQLAEANRVLSSLYRIARTLPGGLEIGTVAEAAVGEIRDAIRASAGAMLVSDAGTFRVVSSYGLADHEGLQIRESVRGVGMAIHRGAGVVRREEMDPPVAAALGEFECWLVAPMRRQGIALGALLAACPNDAHHDPNRLLLARLAEEAAVAVENARLYSRVREITIDEERRRLARELHDGVAQALTHLRFELDFMARTRGSADVRKEVERLSRVVARASSDVRSMILGLRSSLSAEGLAGSLRSYLADLRGLGGPNIAFEARGEARLRPGIESEVFRIAQEAVSNALRHASASEIRVSLVAGVTALRLNVEDDGIGLRPRRSAERGTGMGLNAMRERAEAIGARLEVAERPTGGTIVSLEYAMEGAR